MSDRLDRIERILAQTAEQQQANTEAIGRLEVKTDLIISEAQKMFDVTGQRIVGLESEVRNLNYNVNSLTRNVNSLTDNVNALTHRDRVLDYEVDSVVDNVRTLTANVNV